MPSKDEKVNLITYKYSSLLVTRENFQPHTDINNNENTHTTENLINQSFPMFFLAKHTIPTKIIVLIKKIPNRKTIKRDIIKYLILKKRNQKSDIIFNAYSQDYLKTLISPDFERKLT